MATNTANKKGASAVTSEAHLHATGTAAPALSVRTFYPKEKGAHWVGWRFLEPHEGSHDSGEVRPGAPRKFMSDATVKVCAGCREVKPIESFYRRAGSADGRRSRCRCCFEARRAELLSDPGKRARERNVHRRACREYMRRRRLAHPPTPAEIEAKRLADKLDYRKHAATRAISNAARYQRTKSQVIERVKQWRSRNTDKVRQYRRKRRARKAGGSFTDREFQDLCVRKGNVCLCCGAKPPLTADHIVPLAKGGADDIANIQPLCLTCNSKKQTKIIDYTPIMDTGETKSEQFKEWCLVELMGHQKIVGITSEVCIAGAGMLRVDVPQVDEQPPYTRFFGPSAIYSISPVTEDIARQMCRAHRNVPVERYQLPQIAEKVEAEDPDYQPD